MCNSYRQPVLAYTQPTRGTWYQHWPHTHCVTCHPHDRSGPLPPYGISRSCSLRVVHAVLVTKERGGNFIHTQLGPISLLRILFCGQDWAAILSSQDVTGSTFPLFSGQWASHSYCCWAFVYEFNTGIIDIELLWTVIAVPFTFRCFSDSHTLKVKPLDCTAMSNTLHHILPRQMQYRVLFRRQKRVWTEGFG